jgi:hypothetical protein
MTTEQFLAIVIPLVVQTVAAVWWGASLTASVRQHEKQLADHEERLRAGAL